MGAPRARGHARIVTIVIAEILGILGIFPEYRDCVSGGILESSFFRRAGRMSISADYWWDVGTIIGVEMNYWRGNNC